jgi:hypothetical protein
LVLAAMATFYIARHWETFDEEKFDRAAWFRRAPWLSHAERLPSGPDMIGWMAEDLLLHHLKVGEDMHAVSTLLGLRYDESRVKSEKIHPTPLDLSQLHPPTLYFSTLPERDETRVKSCITVYLGKEFNMIRPVDVAFLYLYFDRDDKYLGGRIGGP